MPAPSAAGFSTDRVLYTWIYEPLSKWLCFLDPNWITVACFFMIGPILWAIKTRAGWGVFLGLIFLRMSLDCLDGAVARSCNKRSKLGAILDTVDDTASMTVLLVAFPWLLLQARKPRWAAVSGAVFLYATVLCALQMIGHLSGKPRDEVHGLERIVNDNTVAVALGAGAFGYWLLC